MLAQSDHLIMQALLPPSGPSMYLSDRESAPYDRFTSAATLSAPVSAFSRYAALYSLRGDIIHYGRACSGAVNMALLSHQTHGNWVCDPKMFY